MYIQPWKAQRRKGNEQKIIIQEKRKGRKNDCQQEWGNENGSQ